MAKPNNELDNATEKIANELGMTIEELQAEIGEDLKNNPSFSNCLVCKDYAQRMKLGEPITDGEFNFFVIHRCGY